MSYALPIDKQAAKTLKSLNQPTNKTPSGQINRTDEKPMRPPNLQPVGDGTVSTKIQGRQLGEFFEVDNAEQVIAIVAIKPRSRAYRKL